MRDGDTIVALSSGSLPSGVAVIRLSGPEAGPLLVELRGALPRPRVLALSTFSIDDDVLDRGLAAWFPGPQSFTGEDCAELQLHGSPAVVKAALRWLSHQPGVRLADAGEFTRRAFEAGKFDLTAVEGFADLIAAETEGQRRQALARSGGDLSRQVANWRETLLDLRAEIEARLDFADEGDVAAELPVTIGEKLSQLAAEMRAALGSFERGRIMREGFRVAIAGPPNAGKSSLLNALVKSDLAIVSDEPGTTRDVREVRLDIDGQLVLLVDMAGLREAAGKAEAEGVRRAYGEVATADLVLWLCAPDIAPIAAVPSAGPQWLIATKLDLGLPRLANCGLAVSAATGEGIDILLDHIGEAAGSGALEENPLVSHERDRLALRDALAALDDLDMGRLEIAGEQLRRAGFALERLIGRMGVEDVLDRLFSSFCIGK